MSSVAHAGPDAMVTLKVMYDGTTRRAKMPLREMIPSALEEHVRSFLHIPAETKIMVERYSDSAAAYVMLDSANMGVYKQLYRAAKAKSKLKLRVSVLSQDKTTPKPVSVEDEPESAPANPSPPATSSAASGSQATLSKQYDANLLKEAAKLIEKQQSEFDARMQRIIKNNEELASLTSQFAGCQPFTTTSTVPKASGPLTPACPASGGAMFAVCCNSCEKNVPGAHYHCSTCDDGDFDLCQSCVDQGITCYSDEHWLIKRTMNNGQIVNSTTETIAPKAKSAGKAAVAPKPEPVVEKKQEPKEGYAICRKYAPAVVGEPPVQRSTATETANTRWAVLGNMRTCNSCVRGKIYSMHQCILLSEPLPVKLTICSNRTSRTRVPSLH